tara:strand:+ start:1112 stop:1216 length:105 start_codon:yes stop_codon:yes gene_type:complete
MAKTKKAEKEAKKPAKVSAVKNRKKQPTKKNAKY